MTLGESLHTAEKLLAAGDLVAAKALLEKCVSADPSSFMGWHLLALAALRLKETDVSLTSVQTAIRLKPDHVDSHFLLGQIQLDRKCPDLALLAFEKVTHLAPELSSGWTALSYAYWDQGEVVRARESLLRALAIKPDDLAALNLLGNADAALGMSADALVAFDKAISLSSKNYAALMSSALVLGNLGRVPEAMRRVEAAIAILPTAQNARELLKDLHLLEALEKHDVRQAGPAGTSPAASLNDYAAIIRDQISSRAATRAMVCFFHVEQARPHAVHQFQPGARPDYISMLGITLAQAVAVLGAHVVILTDETTRFPENFSADIVRLPLKREWIMYERMRAARALASSGRMTLPTAFLDTDVYVLDRFDAAFADEFDVGLTWRHEFPLMPVNEGVILAQAGRADKVSRFFDGCLRNYEELANLEPVRERYKFDIREWRGGQLSLARHLRWQTPARDIEPRSSASLVVDDVKIKFLPDQEYNFAFKSTMATSVLDSKKAIHFKGSDAKKHLAAFHVRAGRGS